MMIGIPKIAATAIMTTASVRSARTRAGGNMDRLRADGWNDPRPGRSEAPGRDRRERARRRSDQPRLLEREELAEVTGAGPGVAGAGEGEGARRARRRD